MRENPSPGAWAGIGSGLVTLAAVLWGVGLLAATSSPEATAQNPELWDTIRKNGWYLAALVCAGLGGMALIWAGVTLAVVNRGPKYVHGTTPYQDGSHYFTLARDDGADFGFAIARVFRTRLLLPDVDEGEPTTVKRTNQAGQAVTYCYPDHFEGVTRPPKAGRYRVRWSISQFADPRLRPKLRKVATTRFEITEADHQAARAALETATPEKPPESHDPDEDYGGTLSYEVSGQGRFRYLFSGLHDVGNGWDRGVEMEAVIPSGKLVRVGGWQGLDAPSMRRSVEQGAAVRAEMEGSYIIRWRNIPLPQYGSEVIAEEAVTLGPTGPMEGWVAHHADLGEVVMFQVDRDSPERGLLHGFKCEIYGPGGPFEADDRNREGTFGLPRLTGQGSFSFPNDFSDAPARNDLRDGNYQVYWVAWEADDQGQQLRSLDVARDSFHVTRSGFVE